MRRVKTILAIVFGICLLTACGSDDDFVDDNVEVDPTLTSVERSVVGWWQLTEQYSYNKKEPVKDTQVIEFRADRTEVSYQNGEMTYVSPFWVKPVTDRSDVYYLYHNEDENYEYSTYSCTIEVSKNQLKIHSSGCFNQSTTVYKRISGLDGVNQNGLSVEFEKNPTTLEGTWYLDHANFAFIEAQQPELGEVIVTFNSSFHLMAVRNQKKTQAHFMPSGTYLYEITQEGTYSDGTAYMGLKINNNPCTARFWDGMLVLDYGMAYDGPGYFFRKVRK